MEHLDLMHRMAHGARTVEQRAAVVLLTSLPWVVGRDDVIERWYAVDGDQVTVDWRTVADDVDRRRVPLSDGERAALRVAASIAGHGDVNLAAVFRHLDTGVAAALNAALYVLGDNSRGVLVNDHHRFVGQEER